MNCPTCAPPDRDQTAIAPRVHKVDVPTEGPISHGALSEDADTTWAAVDFAALEEKTTASTLTVGRLISSVRATASSLRGSDKRRGVKRARVQLGPPSGWEVDVHISAGTP